MAINCNMLVASSSAREHGLRETLTLTLASRSLRGQVAEAGEIVLGNGDVQLLLHLLGRDALEAARVVDHARGDLDEPQAADGDPRLHGEDDVALVRARRHVVRDEHGEDGDAGTAQEGGCWQRLAGAVGHGRCDFEEADACLAEEVKCLDGDGAQGVWVCVEWMRWA